MLSHLAPARSLARVALAAALAVTLMSGCGGDDDATPSQSVSTAAAAAAAPASKPTDGDCPVTASELSERLDVELRAARPDAATKVGCAFRAKADCPCGPTKYAEIVVVIAGGLAKTVSTQRADYLRVTGTPANADPFTDRPDLGKDAYMVKPQGQRGRSATFPSSDGAAVVSVTFGFQDASNRDWVADDTRAADSVISLVAQRMS
jgi:hypothetical protein